MNVTAETSPTGQGPPTWRVVAAFVMMMALAAALVLVTRSPSRQAAAAVRSAATLTTAAATQSSKALPVPADRLMDDVAAAMAAWGLFAATGELSTVYEAFAEGPQLEQLLAEAPDRIANAPGLPAFEFTLSESEIASIDDRAAVIGSSVRMSRPGTEPAEFRWEIEMRWDDTVERWLLYTVWSLDG